jgi:cyclophilin family peptidyl-prolyl cis-trans isomerase
MAARCPTTLLVISLCAGVLTACGGGGDDDSTSTAASLPAGCHQVPRPLARRVNLKPPRERVPTGANLTATVETSCGSFRIALDASDSPKTVSSFVYLARRGVYDHTIFHRIVPGFVVQGGDPTQTGSGGPGYSIREPPPANAQYRRGTVAMAKTAIEPPGQSGSQFFVVTVADAGLPPQYAIFGKVSQGQGVVSRIASLGDPASGQTGTARATVVIRRIAIQGG